MLGLRPHRMLPSQPPRLAGLLVCEACSLRDHWERRLPARVYRLGVGFCYSEKTRIDINQAYQVAYWKERFGVSQEELAEAVMAKKVEAYLKSKHAP